MTDPSAAEETLELMRLADQAGAPREVVEALEKEAAEYAPDPDCALCGGTGGSQMFGNCGCSA